MSGAVASPNLLSRRCVIRNILPPATLGLLFMLACTGGGSSADPPPPTANPELAMKEVTEPWKSMNLPIDGAVVEASDQDGLILRFPTLEGTEYGLVHSSLVQAFIDMGWTQIEDRERPASRSTALSENGRIVDITTRSRDGRPEAHLAL